MSKKKKIIISFLSFAFVALLSCGIALLPNWNPSPTTPPSDIGQEEGGFETEAATQPTNTSGTWIDSGRRGTSFGGGSGTESDPYLISNAQQLAYLAYMVNAGNTYSGKYFEQTANIDLSAYYWEPIGASSHLFSGNYTANPFGVITNLYTKSDYDYAGLFGYVKNATISNVGISGGYIEGGDYAGGLVGGADGTTTITNCYNTGNVTSTSSLSSYAGGIVGRTNGTTTIITNCYNTGNVTGSSYAGGLVGYADGKTTTITNSYNTGNVTSTSTYSSYAGGIVGRTDGKTTITNCYNTGDVNSSSNSDFSYAGGLVGYVNYKCIIIIENSYNTGNVTSTSSNTSTSSDYSYAGGLVGYTYGKTTITNCYNSGNVTSTTARDNHSYAGGLVGYVNYNARIIIENSYNTGDVNSPTRSYVGGLVGYVNEGTTITIENSYNTGNVTSTSTYSYYAGGLVGDVNRGDLTISNCYNTGDVTGLSTASVTSYVGGIVGYAYRGDLTISNCYNTGDVNSPTRSDVGGLVGYADGSNSLSSCHNIGDISAPSSARVGAIGGYVLSTTFTKCYYYCEGASGGVNGRDVSGTSENANLLGSDIIFRSQSDYTNTALWTEPLWDFDNTWIIVNGKNENYPVLKELTEFTLTVNPNGGTWNDSSSSQTFTQKYNTTKSIPNPDAREGYTFKNWSLSGAGSLSGTTFTFGAGDCTLTAQWSINSYSLSVDPNGGSWNGSSSVSSVSQNYATTKSLTAPSRTGYSLGAWVLDGGGSISTFGKLHDSYTDPFFMDNNNSTSEYNNEYNGTVTHEYIAASNTDIELPTGARILRIKNTGTSSPGLGGFTNFLESYPNAVFYTIIYAKIPVGYNINSAENAYGGGTKTWLTSQAGTGDWQVYIHRYNCGSSGSFSSVNFFYLTGTAGTTSNPVVWDVAYFGTYDATGLSASGSSSTTPTFTYPASNSSIVALWNRSSVTVTINPDGGSYNGSSSNSSISAKYRDLVNLEVPTKTGYTFKGWQITSGSGTITNTQYLWEERSFDGVDDYIALGRDQMYTDKITVSVLAYMDNWAEYGANVNAMRLISCTEGGGWNIESDSSGNIQVAMYDSGIGYKNVTTTKPWSSLSAGWHDFTFSFDGRNARLFIDDAQIACSAEFTSGKIGYYSNNVIFIGAEAGWTTTTPVDGYFKGLIKSVVIINDYALGSYNVHDAGGYLIPQGNVTVKALWEETWAVNYTKPSGKGTEEDPYQVGSASDLAYFAYKTQILGEQCYDHIVLTKDIDLSGYDWMPIGTGRYVVSGVQACFSGTFNGQGHTISNLNINVLGQQVLDEYGLFGLTDISAVLKNFTVLSGQVNGFNTSTGAVVGYTWRSTIDNVTNYANVTGNNYVGGIIGTMQRTSKISNCFNYGNVQGINYVGGVVGGTEDSTETRSIVGVTNMGQVSGHSQVGGIIGRAYHVTVESAYNGYTASVTATTRYAGGVVGYLMNGSTVLKSVNTADVAGLECVAGLVGGAVNGGSLTTSYSEGLISARGSSVTEAGTLVGGASTGMAIADCYFKGTSNKSIGTYYGSKYVPATISNCYVKLNGTLSKTAGSFDNWTIVSGVNDNDPIQKELFYLAGYTGGDEMLRVWLEDRNILSDPSFEYNDWGIFTSDENYKDSTHVRSGNYSWKFIGKEGVAESLNRTLTTYPIDPTHIYFVRMYAYQEVQMGEIQAYWQSAEPTIGKSPLGEAGKWNMYGWRFDRVGFRGSQIFRLDFNNNYVAGELWVDDVLLIDLTAMYGAGNEPSQEECMRLFA